MPPSQLSVNAVHPNFPNRIHKFVLRSVYPISSDAGGSINFITNTDASTSSDWTNLSGLFDSYRVVKIHMEWIPNFSHGSTQVLPPLFVIFDPDDGQAITASSALFIGYPNCKILPVDKYVHAWAECPKVNSISATVGAYSVNEGGFIDLAAPASTCSIQAYSTGLAVSTAYGTLVNTYEVEFVARR